MKAGYFNINTYLNKLYEAAGAEPEEDEDDEKGELSKEKAEKPKVGGEKPKANSAPKPKGDGGLGFTKMDGGEGGKLPDPEGLVIPEENQKAYQWLKKEYHKAQTEVKVVMNMGKEDFEPGYDMQTNLDSVKDFKPGMFGEVKTADNEKKGGVGKNNLEASKSSPKFDKQEGEKPTTAKTATPGAKPAVPAAAKPGAPGAKPAVPGKPESKEHEDKESKDHEAGETKGEEKAEHSKEEKPEVKKIDLKTKKK